MIGRIIPIVLVLISIGLFAGYISPTYNKVIIPLQAQIAQYNGTLAAAADFNAKEAQLTTERSQIPAESITRLETFLPDGVDNVQLILDLNALSARTGVQLSNFDIKGSTGSSASQATSDTGALPLESSSQQVDSIDLSVKAIGSYSAFRSFLSGVELSLRPMDVVEMDLTDSATGVYSYDMTFRIYWLH